MDEVTVRDLRNRGGAALTRVEQGESLRVTRDGVPVAELHPIPRPRLSSTSLLKRWQNVPRVDPQEFRADVDAAVDPSL